MAWSSDPHLFPIFSFFCCKLTLYSAPYLTFINSISYIYEETPLYSAAKMVCTVGIRSAMWILRFCSVLDPKVDDILVSSSKFRPPHILAREY